jgi:hypothetical protein
MVKGPWRIVWKPVPPQPPQLDGEVPGLDFVPLQVPHTSVLEKVSVLVDPLIASMKSISRFIYSSINLKFLQ